MNCFYFLLIGSEVILCVAENVSLQGLYGFVPANKRLQLVSSVSGALVVLSSTCWFMTCSSKMRVWAPVYAASSLGLGGESALPRRLGTQFGALPPHAGRGMAGWLSHGSHWCCSQQMGGFLGFISRESMMCLGGWLLLWDKSAVTHGNRAFLLTEDVLVSVHGMDNFSYVL